MEADELEVDAVTRNTAALACLDACLWEQALHALQSLPSTRFTAIGGVGVAAGNFVSACISVAAASKSMQWTCALERLCTMQHAQGWIPDAHATSLVVAACEAAGH
eukprot:106682-Amphidinium_carterae.1